MRTDNRGCSKDFTGHIYIYIQVLHHLWGNAVVNLFMRLNNKYVDSFRVLKDCASAEGLGYETIGKCAANKFCFLFFLHLGNFFGDHYVNICRCRTS